jgi:hypothetical protein
MMRMNLEVRDLQVTHLSAERRFRRVPAAVTRSSLAKCSGAGQWGTWPRLRKDGCRDTEKWGGN